MGVPYAEVIGDPIGHSKSPLIHGFWLERLGIEADYGAAEVPAASLAWHLRERRDDPDWLGCNVTAPHKIAVMDHLDRVDLAAGMIGAVNTVKRFPDGTLGGTNTDADGFNEPLANVVVEGKHAIILGAGGGARAVLAMLRVRQIGYVTVFNRTVTTAVEMLEDFGGKASACSLNAPLPPADLLVNAVTGAMASGPASIPDLAPLPPSALVYDLVYAPVDTPLLHAARARGLKTIDGLAMLIGQAALAFEIFFGAPPPREHDAELRELLTR